MKDRSFLFAVIVFSLFPILPALVTGQIFEFRDHTDYFVPLRYYTAQELRGGDLPLWNPYSASGERWLANPQTAVFYPPALMFLLLPFVTAYVLFLGLHLSILGIGGFLLFRRWSSGAAAMMGATALALCGPTLSFLDVSNNLATFAWMPVVIVCALERSRVEPRVPLPLAALSISLMFLGGEPFLASCGAFLYAIVCLFSGPENGRSAGRRVRDVVLVGVLSILLSAAQLVPFLEMLRHSDRMGGLEPSQAFRESMAPRDWLSLTLPVVVSRAPMRMTQRFIPTLYVGGGIFLLFVMSLMLLLKHRGESRRPAGALLALAAISALLAAGNTLPGIEELWRGLRLTVNRYPSRLAPLATLAMIGLAVLAIDRLEQLRRNQRVIALLITLVFTAFGVALLHPRRGELSLRVTVFAAGILLWGYIVVMGPELLRHPRVVLILTLILAIDLVMSSRPLLRSQQLEAHVRPYDTMLSKDRKLMRLVSSSSREHPFSQDRRHWLAGYLNLFDRRYDASTAAPVISPRYVALHDLALTQPRLDLVDLLSVGYLLTERTIDHPSVSEVARGGKVRVYINRATFPFVTLWPAYRNAANDDEAFRNATAPANDARRNLFLANPPAALTAALPQGSSAALLPGVQRLEMTPSRVEVAVNSAVPAILVLSQTDAPGWNLTIDGAPQPSLRADGIFRAAFLPAGAHVVVWTYRPWFVTGGIAVSGLTFLICLAVLLRRFRSAEQRSDESIEVSR